MSFQNFSYFLFLALTALLYLKAPHRAQTPILAAASALFYAFGLKSVYASVLEKRGAAAAVFSLAVSIGLLAFCAVFVWRTALRLGEAKAEGRATAGTLRGAILTLLAILAVFKYYSLSPLPTLFAGSVLEKLPFPLGISFFTFAAVSYLVDVARGDCKAEPQLLHVAVFLFFFGTVTSGPICRGGQILPQLRAEHRFDEARTVNSLRLFALGLFKKVAVADVLALVANQVFSEKLAGFGAPMLLLGLVFYTLQLYFDFAGYSDMARASAMLLGITVPDNFKTPFFATNFSGFWSRWHISLSSWLQDYLFMPLAWADVAKTPLLGKGLAKKYEHFPAEFCVFTVFFVSGFWHGNTLPFVVWGILQAAFRVGEELLHRRFGKPKRRGVPQRVLWAKRAGVFCLWACSMVFFRVGSGPNTNTASLAECGAFFAGLLHGYSPVRFVTELLTAIGAGFYDNAIMKAAYLAFLAFGLFLGIYLDAQRFFHFKDKPAEVVLAGQKPLVRWLIYYALVLAILAGLIIQNGGFGGGASFAYANF